MIFGLISFAAGVMVMAVAVLIYQWTVIRNAAPDLKYEFSRYIFSDPEFPWSFFQQGRVVKRMLFPVRVSITFYDAQYNIVTRAEKPGRYGALVKINLIGGIVEHRYITLFRTPQRTYWFDGPAKVTSTLPPGTGIDPAVIETQANDIGVTVKNGFYGDADVSQNHAILLAGLYETSPSDPPAVDRTNVFARDDAWWFVLRKRMGLERKYPHLDDLPKDYGADPDKKWPLILFLHGGHETGIYLPRLRRNGLPKLIGQGKQIPAVVVSPQLIWAERFKEQPLCALLDDTIAKYRIDTDRIYVTGISSGGDGAFRLAMAHPDRIAAIMTVAGLADLVDVARIKSIPTWVFGASDDPIVPVSLTTGIAEALRQAGGNPHLTLFDNIGHDSWDTAYMMDEFYTWLFAQRRGQPEVITPGVPIS